MSFITYMIIPLINNREGSLNVSKYLSIFPSLQVWRCLLVKKINSVICYITVDEKILKELLKSTTSKSVSNFFFVSWEKSTHLKTI